MEQENNVNIEQSEVNDIEVAEQSKESNNAQATQEKAETKTDKADIKTFTQEEVDKIIKDRLARERVKAEKEQEEAKKLAKMNAE